MDNKKYLVKKYYPGFCDICNCPEEHERGYFSTKEEFENFDWLKPLMDDYHIEFEIVDGTINGKRAIYVMDVSDNMDDWYVTSIIYDLTDSDVEFLRHWYPEWKYENMKGDDI